MSDKQNYRLVKKIIFIPLVMLSLAYASVPLYDIFCSVTGFGGTTSTNIQDVEKTDYEIKVRFDASISESLPVEFKPKQVEMAVMLGHDNMAFYTVTNLSSKDLLTTSTYNVVPFSAGSYFVKIDCFCFEEQLVRAGETIEMPLTFYIDPNIMNDEEGKFVKVVTLGYTMFEKVKN